MIYSSNLIGKDVIASAVKTSKLIDKDYICTQNQYWGEVFLLGLVVTFFVLGMIEDLFRSYIRLKLCIIMS
jgi:hypothetical protein